jgi:hypothetical protein
MVAGYADVEPLIKEDPYDPRNRRISILLFDNAGTKSAPNGKGLTQAKPESRVVDLDTALPPKLVLENAERSAKPGP